MMEEDGGRLGEVYLDETLDDPVPYDQVLSNVYVWDLCVYVCGRMHGENLVLWGCDEEGGGVHLEKSTVF